MQAVFSNDSSTCAVAIRSDPSFTSNNSPHINTLAEAMRDISSNLADTPLGAVADGIRRTVCTNASAVGASTKVGTSPLNSPNVPSLGGNSPRGR